MTQKELFNKIQEEIDVIADLEHAIAKRDTKEIHKWIMNELLIDTKARIFKLLRKDRK